MTAEELLKIIPRLEHNIISGPDGIPPTVVRNCASDLLEPLLKIFNLSLSYDHLPVSWKAALMIPIHKKGDKSDIGNYRPISILNTIPKMLDCLVANRTSDFLMGKLAETQHGFRRSKSTITNILIFNECIASSLERSEQVNSIFIDFGKAFDSVNQIRLLQMAWNFGTGGDIFMWLQSYLSNRTKAVRLNGHISPFINITSEVSQSSHLGPILFIMFINSLPSYVQFAKCRLYADEVRLFLKISSTTDCSKLLEDLNSLVSWSVENGRPIRIPKCHALSFCRSRSRIF